MSEEAIAEKNLGNEAYKKRDFATAHKHYDAAIRMSPKTCAFYTNKAAAYFEEGKYQEAIDQCKTAIDIGREVQADYTVIAKAMARIANSYMKLGNKKDAMYWYEKSLAEHRDPEVVKKHKQLEAEIKEEERRAYINPEISEQEKAEGNALFQKGDYPNALKHYNEAIKRNPDNHVLYSNRAACYQKLMEFHKVIEDCDTCLKKEPNFVKAYLRKGTALVALREFSRAQRAYRKRKLLEEKQLVDQNKKFFKQGDLIAKQNEEVLKKLNATNNPNKQQNDNCEEYDKKLNKSADETETKVLPRTEVIRRLRDRGEPILLFAETEVESFKRLRKLEIHQPESNRGFRNDFQEAMDQVDQAYLDEILNSESQTQNAKPQKKKDDLDLDGAVAWEEIENMAKTIGKNNRDYDMHVITLLFQHILKLWRDQLNSYSAHEKMTTKVKTNRVIFTQTKEYMKPLFRKLKNRTLPEDILESLVDISKNLVNRNYIAASDSYLEMAIGNAPWPIGVTMVGIHARTGREKIFSKNVAHVMNDETQRKYIQGLKRLMTKCQECFPTDPSRCVEFAPTH